MYSLVVPVYQNEDSIPELLLSLEKIAAGVTEPLEVVFVVDGSPDRSAEVLRGSLGHSSFVSRLVVLSRTFGSFAAIRAGLTEARGSLFAVMAADLQEPPELICAFFRALETEPVDVTIGTRDGRDDPLPTRLASNLFWRVYRSSAQPEMPPGGVDVFGCSREVRGHLLSLDESNSTLVGLLFWLGFRRKLIPYRRLKRKHGRSAWTLAKKLRYLGDSVFAFSDLPIRVLIGAGALGLAFSIVFGLVVLTARLAGPVEVPGYATTILVISFFTGLNSFGLGIIGSYVWRAFENTKRRPQAIIMSLTDFDGGS